MLTQQTFEKLYTMKPNGMTDAFGQQQEDTEIASLSFEERFGLLVDQQWIWKENRALARCLAGAKFKLSAAGRRHRLPSCERSRPQAVAQPHQRAELGAAASQHFSVRANRHWKSYLACALARKACRDGFTALYRRAPQLFRDLAVARADGSLPRRLPRLARLDVLIVDDWVMAPLSGVERRDFLEIGDDRYQRRSTILTSQLPVAKWHAQIE